MKTQRTFILTILFIIFLSFGLFAQYPDTLWTRTYGWVYDDWGNSVLQTSDGGYLIAGGTESAGTLYDDIFLIRTNEDGDTIWTKVIENYLDDWAASIEHTFDGNYIIGGTCYNNNRDMFLMKIDDNGNILWKKMYGGSDENEWGLEVQSTNDGGYVIAGITESYGAGERDAYIVKTDANGDTLWTKTYGGPYDDEARSIAQTNDLGYIVVGTTRSFGNGYTDVYLIKLNSDGSPQWMKNYGGTSFESANTVRQTTDGGYIIGGYTDSYGAGSGDFYLIKTDTNGDTMWTKTYGGPDGDYGRTVIQTIDGCYVLTGFTSSYGAGSEDAYLVKANTNGDTLWTKTYGGSSWDRCGGYSRTIQQTSDSGYIVVATTTSFGVGLSDVWLLKIETDAGVEEKKEIRTKVKDIQLKCYPNPFASTTTITLHRESENRSIGVSEIQIYDISGREVRSLSILSSQFSVPSYVWDGCDENGKVVSPGIYFINVGGKSIGKVVKVR
jgi:hypothetical protein